MELLTERFDGRGGLILVDRRGRVGIARSTRLMSHAIARPGQSVHVGA
jgi:isoaspartyl peptidase/L-asparaginase-like protein (Ntn-hydrolase superfamily)